MTIKVTGYVPLITPAKEGLFRFTIKLENCKVIRNSQSNKLINMIIAGLLIKSNAAIRRPQMM